MYPNHQQPAEAPNCAESTQVKLLPTSVHTWFAVWTLPYLCCLCLTPPPGKLLLILQNPTQMFPFSKNLPCCSVAHLVLKTSCSQITQDILLKCFTRASEWLPIRVTFNLNATDIVGQVSCSTALCAAGCLATCLASTN